MDHGAQHSSRKTGLQLCSLFPFQLGRREFPVLRFGTEYRTWFISSLCSLTQHKFGNAAQVCKKEMARHGGFSRSIEPPPYPAPFQC